MSKLTDWLKANPPATVDLTVEDLAPKRNDKDRLGTERERLQRNAEFYSGEQLRYETVASLAMASAAECEALAESYRLALSELESRVSGADALAVEDRKILQRYGIPAHGPVVTEEAATQKIFDPRPGQPLTTGETGEGGTSGAPRR